MKYLDVQVVDFLVGFESVDVEGQSGDFMRSVGHQQHGELELGHVFAFLLVQHLERLYELMRDALHDAHFGLRLVLHGPEREGHGSESLGHVGEEFPGVLHLQHVRLVGLLVDRDFGVLFPALALARRNQHVDGVNFVQLEVEFVVLLPLGFARVLDDGLLSVDYVLAELVREHALDGLAVVAFGDLLHGVGHSISLKISNRLISIFLFIFVAF